MHNKTILFFILGILVVSCGFKGPLVLPKQPQPTNGLSNQYAPKGYLGESAMLEESTPMEKSTEVYFETPSSPVDID